MVPAESRNIRGARRTRAPLWRPLLGVAVGTLLVATLQACTSFLPGDGLQAPSGGRGDTAILAVGIVGWGVAGVGIGALSGWISGRLELLVAVLSGVAGIACVFTFAVEFLEDLGIRAAITSVPLLILLAVGSSLVFFNRRSDIR